MVKKETKKATAKTKASEAKKEIKKAEKVSKKTAPTTMEELLKTSGYELTIPTKGETITGLVTGVTRKAVLVDIGAKTEGLVAEKEYDIARDFIETLKIGDEVEVYVLTDENERGQIMF